MINALTLFRRYYLRHSLLECDARRLIASAMVLGAKLSEVNLPAETFDKILKDFNLEPDGTLF